VLGLKDKSAPEKKVHGKTALTPAEWRALLAKTGEFRVIGGRPGDVHVSAAFDREASQRIFDAVIEKCAFAPGYSMRIVAVTPCSD